MENKKNNNYAIIIFLIIIIILLVAFIIYKELNSNQTNKEKIDNKNNQYTMNIYKDKYNNLCSKMSDSCNTVAYTLKTETENAEVVGIEYGDSIKYILYKDNSLKLYNVETGKIVETSLNSDYISFNNIFEVDDKYLSVSHSDNENIYVFLLNVENGNIELEDKVVAYGGKYCKKLNFYILNSSFDTLSIEKAYNNDKKLIFENKSDEIIGEEKYSVYNDTLYIYYNNNIEKYDINGNLVSSLKYDNFKQIINDKVIYIKNNKLVVESLNDSSLNEIVNWNDNFNYDTYLSRYYSRDDLDELEEPDKKEGLYLVIYYQNKIDDNYGMEYCYTGSEIVTYPVKQAMGGRAKPVLYLYPTEETKVKVRFAHPEYLTTTYPKYNKEWVVTASPNGDLKDENNKYYYALYWDEIRYHEVSFKEGFYVTKDDAIDFLEEKLTLIGLNQKEKNEFIMYWLPILENNGQSLVYFELTEERELNNKLIIEPTPDSLLRVNIHIKKVNKKINIKEQKLESFERVGFTAVEWGGMTY